MSKILKAIISPPAPVVREATIKRNLRWVFTSPEILEISKRLAEKNGAVATLEDEKKRATKDYAARIATVENEVSDLARKVTNGYEFRDIDCRVVFDTPKPGMKTVTRLDTNEQVGVEEMTFPEKQMTIPAVDEASPEKPAEEPSGEKKRKSSPGVVAVLSDGRKLETPK
jgi:hypothetical protein